MTSDFALELISQKYMSAQDFSAHGSIQVVIGDVVVTSDEPEYGITQSALSLLRTLENNRPDDDRDNTPLEEGFLLCHDCGFPISFGCGNFGTNWEVRHEGEHVILTNPLLLDGSHVKTFDVGARISLAAYVRQIVPFASEARRVYFADGAQQASEIPDFDKRFWAEFDERLARAEASISGG
ncbi:MAG: hypothetical protein ABI797_06280 [Chloroflexota bacterium]